MVELICMDRLTKPTCTYVLYSMRRQCLLSQLSMYVQSMYMHRYAVMCTIRMAYVYTAVGYLNSCNVCPMCHMTNPKPDSEPAGISSKNSTCCATVQLSPGTPQRWGFIGSLWCQALYLRMSGMHLGGGKGIHSPCLNLTTSMKSIKYIKHLASALVPHIYVLLGCSVCLHLEMF